MVRSLDSTALRARISHLSHLSHLCNAIHRLHVHARVWRSTVLCLYMGGVRACSSTKYRADVSTATFSVIRSDGSANHKLTYWPDPTNLWRRQKLNF